MRGWRLAVGYLVLGALIPLAIVNWPSMDDRDLGPQGRFAVQVPATAKELLGAWVLNKAWDGYMGVAIRFNGDGTFDYWFYSDVGSLGPPPKYPVRGRWEIKGSAVMLESTAHVYDTTWHLIRHQGQLALMPMRTPTWDRLLFQIAGFDERNPFLHRR